MPDITGIDVAISRQVGKQLRNASFRKPSFLGLLMSFDTYYNEPAGSMRFNPVGIKGGKMRTSFVTASPEWDSSNPLDPDYENRRKALQKRITVKALEIEASALEIEEPIDRYEMNRYADDDLLDDWGVKVANILATGFVTKLDKHLFPAVQAVGGAGQAQNTGRVMQFAYPLQNGYGANDPAGTLGTYTYGGLDLGNQSNMQAINVGTDSTPWVLSESNLYKDLIIPLRDRGAGNIDCIMCGTLDFNWLRTQLQNRIQCLDPKRIMPYGGPFFYLDEGIFVILETGIDRLPKTELYIGDSATIRAALPTMDKIDSMIKMIDPYQGIPSIIGMQGYGEVAWFNESPRAWARAFNTSRT